MRNTIQFYLNIPYNGLTPDEVHRFVSDFTDRYATQLNEGRDLRFVYDFELSCLETGLKYFYLGQTYTNSDGKVMKVIDRREDMLVIEYEGEYYGCDYWYEDGMEYCVMNDTRWSAADTTESTTNGER